MQRVAIFESTGKKEVVKWAETAIRILKKLKIECVASPELTEKFSEEIREYVKPAEYTTFEKTADFIISFGGDGTMLSAARLMLKSNIPIMGFNVGKLGFLAEFSVNKMEDALNDLLKGNYRVVDRTVLETSIDGELIYALNDFVIEKKDSSRMVTIEGYTNDHYIGSLRADGIIIATPTGSTAYSLSCGGPILAPSTEVICITPIAPHSLTLRPLVIPDSSELVLKVYSPNSEAQFVADGHITRVLKNNDEVHISRSPMKAKLIKPLNSSYYDLLRTKLLWAANVVSREEIQ